MLLKNDWEDAQARLIVWWQGQIVDRVALAVTAPRERKLEGFPEEPGEPDDPYFYWTDVDYRIASAEATMMDPDNQTIL